MTPYLQGRATTNLRHVEGPDDSDRDLRGHRHIAKAEFVVACCPDGTSWTATNDLEGMTVTVARLNALAPALIVLEATGGYETALVAALAAASLPVVVANPRQVRDCAKATGQLAKTDRLDAQLLALFAEQVHPTPRPLPDAVLQQLDALMTRRRQLFDMLTAEGNRLEHAAAPNPPRDHAPPPLARAPDRGR